MTDWQPIETAPKDGTRILGWGQISFETHESAGTVCWQKTWKGGYWISDPNEATEYDYEECKLTHWMPLPDPPK